MYRIFILSPARTDGKRASLLWNDSADFDLARQLRSPRGAPLGDVFSFLSGLYFRGKLAYSHVFGRPPNAMESHYIITSSEGLARSSECVSVARLKSFGDVPIDLKDPRYSEPLRASVADLARGIPSDCEVVLLGSIATDKYASILVEAVGEQLMFPREFIGRGDMSRGGLLLRAARSGEELEYASLLRVTSRRGQRPPKLPKLSTKVPAR